VLIKFTQKNTNIIKKIIPAPVGIDDLWTFKLSGISINLNLFARVLYILRDIKVNKKIINIKKKK
jgi:hypothetical protein